MGPQNPITSCGFPVVAMMDAAEDGRCDDAPNVLNTPRAIGCLEVERAMRSGRVVVRDVIVEDSAEVSFARGMMWSTHSRRNVVGRQGKLTVPSCERGHGT